LSDLAAFIAAQLDEDEAAAKAATDMWPVAALAVLDDPERAGWYPLTLAAATHIARHDPARVLREVRFKRALMATHQPVPFWGNNPPPLKDQTPERVKAWYCQCQCPDGVIEGTYPCDTAKLIVSVWDDHPDHDQGWKP